MYQHASIKVISIYVTGSQTAERKHREETKKKKSAKNFKV